LNLLAALDRGKKRQKVSKGTIAILAVVAALAAAVALFLMYTINEGDIFTERRDAANAFVEAPGATASYEESIANQAAARRAQTRADALTGVVNAINTYPDMSGDDFKTLFGVAGKDVTMSNISYDRQAGILSFSAKCKSAERIPAFIAELRSAGVFFDVYYDGYSGGSYTVAGEPDKDGKVKNTVVTEYSFSVTCLVNTDGQRNAAQG
jgi:hypothetical protein